MKFFEWLLGRGRAAFLPETADRETRDASAGLSPAKVDAIMQAANGGDIREQCRLARELPEHNAEIAQALATRVNAVAGCHWSIAPGGEGEAAKAAAAALEAELRAIDGSLGVDSFEEMLEDLMGALLPGFAVSQILWRDGGHVAGFSHIPQENFTLVDGFYPRLVLSSRPQGVVLPRDLVLYHRLRVHGGDPARGGLIRPLAWLHCFMNGTEKNLLAFTERYGMPFLVVKADAETYQRERHTIKELIRNFGSSGGGIFSRNTETQLLQAASVSGDVYFRLREALQGSIERLLLGQSASSGDGGGLSRDGAQDKVRRDILESDCRRLMRTVNAQLCVPWTRFNCPPGTPAPRFVLDCAAPEDMAHTAQMLAALRSAGLEADPAEMSERFGIRLSRAPEPAGPQGAMLGMSDTAGAGDEDDDDVAPTAGRAWLGAKAREILDALEAEEAGEDEGEFAECLAGLCDGFDGDGAPAEELAAASCDKARQAAAAAEKAGDGEEWE